MTRTFPNARSPRPGLCRPCLSLCKREIVRFLRQKGRVIGALGTPLVFWLLIGGGLGRSFRIDDAQNDGGYLQYTYPGAVAAILLFTAIFSMITIIDDRREGFLQGVLVAPVSRLAIVLGKILGASVLAIGQAAVFLLLAPLADFQLGLASVLATLAAMTLISVAVTALGFWTAWLMETTQGFHAIMNLVLMPMLVLSGAFFPPAGSASILRWIAIVNPMTYAVSLLRSAMYVGSGAAIASPIAWPVALVVSIAFALTMLAIAIYVTTKATTRVLQ